MNISEDKSYGSHLTLVQLLYNDKTDLLPPPPHFSLQRSCRGLNTDLINSSYTLRVLKSLPCVTTPSDEIPLISYPTSNDQAYN